MYIEECTRHLLLMYIQQKVSIEMNSHLEHIISVKNDSIEYSLLLIFVKYILAQNSDSFQRILPI